MKLQILIPTYNRSNYLLKNIAHLASHIRELEAHRRIGLLISDNASPDGTAEKVRQFQEQNSDLELDLFVQQKNVGLERNALHVFEKASSAYVMFLGDDDFLSRDYIREIDEALARGLMSCIIPAIQPIDLAGVPFAFRGRDRDNPTRVYPRGGHTAALFLRRGHQLSGVTFLREGTLEAYKNQCPNNIYPFMFFVGFNALRGDLLHLTDYPVQVTVVDQSAKDWNYGTDGLVCERFKNARGVFGRGWCWWRLVAEWEIMNHNNRTFLWEYGRQGARPLAGYLLNTLTCHFLTFPGKLLFVFFSITEVVAIPLRRMGVFRFVRFVGGTLR